MMFAGDPNFSRIWFLSLLASIEHHMPTTARLCLYWLVVPASGLQNGGWQQQMQHFHDSSPLLGEISQMDILQHLQYCLRLLLCWSLLTSLRKVHEGSLWLFWKTQHSSKHFGIWEHLQLQEKNSNTQFIIKTGWVKSVFLLNKKSLARF